MPSHDANHGPAGRVGAPAESGSQGALRSSGTEHRLSRRFVLQGAATAGAAGLAATAIGVATGSALAATGPSSPPSGSEVMSQSGPIVVHVRNAKSGEIDVFSGTSRTRLRDKELAARIARAAG
ncbi:MAG TPA: hypothetical protein VGS19_21300 [Streptosporangiaceae bacterium]|nr:hypothetical protein [Streptosporangiaceae bacterium]